MNFHHFSLHLLQGFMTRRRIKASALKTYLFKTTIHPKWLNERVSTSCSAIHTLHAEPRKSTRWQRLIIPRKV